MSNPTYRSKVVSRLKGLRRSPEQPHGHLDARVAALEAAVEENRRLNQRLADVVDVVTEVLVPAADRDDERMRKALADLDKSLGNG